MMLIHGGAFYVGSKERLRKRLLATNLARRGYVVADQLPAGIQTIGERCGNERIPGAFRTPMPP
ncbi:MAG: hypothetical protein MZV63_58215 [Marinilabiliales bacterium]|nr:hypothetical protein [Marinilabiliales bacterium]